MAQIANGSLTITNLTDGANANIWTTSVAPTTPNYTFTISNLTGSTTDAPRVGDIILQGVYRYTITNINSTTVLAGSRQSLQGAAGGKWYSGTGITGTSTTATVFSGSGVSNAVVGDMYLNTSTNNVYQCTVAGNASTAKWIYVSNIKGSVGPQGRSTVKVETEYYRKLSGGSAPTSTTTGSTTIPDYIDGCTYYTRTITYFDSGDPNKSEWVINSGLTNEIKNAYDAWIKAGVAESKTAKVYEDNTGLVVASGIGGAAITGGSESTYGYNTKLAPTFLGLRYNNINLARLTTTETNPALEFYIPTVNGSGVPSQGAKGLSISATALTFYNPSNSSKAIELGTKNSVSTLSFYNPSNSNISMMDLTSSGLIFKTSAGAEIGKFGSDTSGGLLELSGRLNIKGGGRIGQDSDNYWEFGDNRSYDSNDSAYLIGKGTASLQLGETGHWRLDKNRIHAGWYQLNDSSSSTPMGSLHFDTGAEGSTTYYWDYGMHYPDKAGGGNNKFLYIRRSNDSTSTTLGTMKGRIDDDSWWTYKFYIDGDGNIHAGDVYSNGTLISGQSAPYLLKSGGTMTGSITMSNGGKFVGDVTGNVSGSAGKLSNTSIIGNTNKPVYFTANGVPAAISYEINKSVPSNALFTDENVKSTEANTTKLWLVGSDTSGTRTGTLKYDSGIYITTTAGVLHATTFEGNLSGTATKANQDGDGNVIKTTYLKLSGGNVTGAVTFGSSVSVDELIAGDLVVNGNASFTNNAQFNTINGVTVGSSPKFTDTVTTVSVTGSGNAVTSASATNGALTLTKGTTFLTSHQTVSNKAATLAWNSLVTVATIGSTDITVKLPSNPDTNTTYTIATGDSNGQIKVTPSSGNAYNVSVKGLGSAAFVNTSLFPIVSTYTLAAAKAVRIQYPTHAPVLISAQRSNDGGRLILLGGGYGAEGTVRNDFQELVSSSTNNFTWTLPSSSSISKSIEIMNVQTSGTAAIIVWSSAAATFTEISALSNDAMNRAIITSANYTNYTVTKTGSGASGNWGINVTGTAANVTGTVAIANGGTGQTTANDAINALLSGLPVWSADPLDTTYFIRQDTGGTAAYGKVPATTLWNYVSGKLPSWSKASSKPSYSYSEIGSAPDAFVSAEITSTGAVKLIRNSGSNPLTLSTEIKAVEAVGATKLTDGTSTNGIDRGSADQPVYFDDGVPVAGYYIPKLNGSNRTSAISFYAPTTAGTTSQVLIGGGSNPTWKDINSLIPSNAGTADAFSSAATVELTGDTIGSASSTKGWSVATTTKYVTATPYSTLNTQEAIDNFLVANKFQFGIFKTSEANNIEMASNDGMILSLPWSSTTYGAQIALDDNASGVMKFRGKSTNWGDWRTVIHDGNYTTYTVKKDGTGATGTWGISISGNAATASSVTWDNVSGKPSTFTPSTHNHTYIISPYVYNSNVIKQNITAETLFGNDASINKLSCGFMENGPFGNWADVIYYTGYCKWGGTQIATEYNAISPRLAIRKFSQSRNDWGDWAEFIKADGGTWGISISGNAATASAIAWSGITDKPINLKAYSGSLASGGWAQLNGKANSPTIAIAYNSGAASWNSGTYSASMVFGCQDTRGLLDLAYNTPIVTFGGTSYGGATDDNPKWYFTLSGTSGQTYTFPGASKTLAATDGTGASGTWGISISGNAATATSATSATSATYSSYPKIVAGNEIRFDVATKPSSASDLYFGYAWSDGSKDAKINNYVFDNGNSTLAGIKAANFNGYTIASSVPTGAVFTDTKNTAGSTNTDSALFLIGATSQAANPQTYSHDTVKINTTGQLISTGYEMTTSSSMSNAKCQMRYEDSLQAIVFSFA